MVLKGAGSLLTYANVNGVLVPKLCGADFDQLKLDFAVEQEDVPGGDSLYRRDVLIKGKKIDATINNTAFDLNQLSLQQGATVNVADIGAQITVLAEYAKPLLATTPLDTTDVDLKFKSTWAVGTMMAKYRNNNKPVTIVATKELVTAVGQIYVSDTGVVTFFTGSNGDAGQEFLLYYKRVVTADTMSLLVNDTPLNVGLVFDGQYRQDDNTIQGLQIEFYSATPYGTFTIEGKRRAASTHGLQFAVQDPRRPDGAVGLLTRYSL